MSRRIACLAATCLLLGGCASFYSGKGATPDPRHMAAIKGAVAGRMAAVTVDSITHETGLNIGSRCAQLANLQQNLPPLLHSLGITENEAGDAEFRIETRLTKCDGYSESMTRSAWNTFFLLLNAGSLFVIPYVYDNEVALQVTVKDRSGAVLYSAVTEENSTELLTLLALPLMLTHAAGSERDKMVKTLLAKHVAEMNEQGTFE